MKMHKLGMPGSPHQQANTTFRAPHLLLLLLRLALLQAPAPIDDAAAGAGAGAAGAAPVECPCMLLLQSLHPKALIFSSEHASSG
jgi:hypothetical protein